MHRPPPRRWLRACARARSMRSLVSATSWGGKAPATRHRGGSHQLDHSFRTAGNGKTSLAQVIAALDAFAFRAIERRGKQRGRPAPRDRRGRRACGKWRPADAALHRRDSSLQQGAAGRAAARCREWPRAADRRDDAQSVFLRQLAAGLALTGIPARAAHGSRPAQPHGAGFGGRGTRLGRARYRARRGRRRAPRDDQRRRCAQVPERARARRAHDSSGSEGCIHITLAVAEESIQRKAVVYDGDGDAHYDTISAFIKSMRGSDPDAALYWLAKRSTRARIRDSSRGVL